MHEPSALAPLEIRTFVQASASGAAARYSSMDARLLDNAKKNDGFLYIFINDFYKIHAKRRFDQTK